MNTGMLFNAMVAIYKYHRQLQVIRLDCVKNYTSNQSLVKIPLNGVEALLLLARPIERNLGKLASRYRGAGGNGHSNYHKPS